MSRIDPEKFEMMATGIVAGLSTRAAGTAAGYSETNNRVYDIVKREDFKDRVAALRDEASWDGGPEVACLLRALKATYDMAMSNQAFDSAARMVVHAGKLKKDVPRFRAVAEVDPWAQFADD
jgi:hypothetical protein